MNKFHKLVAKVALLVVIWLVISLVAPWALSAADTVTNVVGALLVIVPGYVTVFVVLPSIAKSFFKAENQNSNSVKEKA